MNILNSFKGKTRLIIKLLGLLLLTIFIFTVGFFSYNAWDQNQKIIRIYKYSDNKIFADKMAGDLSKLAEIVHDHPTIKFNIGLEDLVYPRKFDKLCCMPPYPMIKTEDMKKAFGFEWKYFDDWKDSYIGESWTMLFIDGKDVIPVRLQNDLIHLFPNKSSFDFSYRNKNNQLVCYSPQKDKLKLEIYKYHNYIQNIDVTR